MCSETNMLHNSTKLPQWLWTVPILLLAFALTVPHFMQDAVWFDEAYTHLYSGTGNVQEMPLTKSLLLIAQTDPWPPGYYLLNIAWGRLTGRSVFSSYMLPALIGLLAISVVFKTVTQFYNLRAGLHASLMLATSAFFIHYMHENRAYTLFVLAISLVFWFYWMMITRVNYQKRWLQWGFLLSIALALYTHYVAGAFVLGIMTYHLLFERPSVSTHETMNLKRWQNTIRLWVNGCLLFTPWFAMLLGTLAAESANHRALPFLSLIGYALYGFSNNLHWLFAILILSSLLLWKLPQIRFIWTVLVSSLIVIIIINQFTSFLFHPRHILPYLLLLILMIIPVLNRLEKHVRGLSFILIGAYAGMGIAFSITPDFMYRIPTHIHPIPLLAITDIQASYQQCVSDDDAVIFSIDTPTNEGVQSVALQYYFLKEISISTQLGGLTTWKNNEGNHELLDLEIARTRIESFIGDTDTIWLMTLPDLANQSNILLLDSVLTEQDYRRCPILETRENADIWSYTRGENRCNLSC